MVWSVEHVPTPHSFPYAPTDWVPGIYEGIKDIPQSTFVWGCIEWLETHGMLLLLATLNLMAIRRYSCLAIDEKDDQPLGKKTGYEESAVVSHETTTTYFCITNIYCVYIYMLVGGFKHFSLSIISGIILPIDELIFFKMVKLHHQPVYMVLFSHRHWFFMLRDRSSGYLSEWPFWRPKGRRRSRRWRTP